MSRRKTLDEFIADARSVHGNKYNYDKVNYNGTNEVVIITCPKHGDFPMTPHNHKAGHGCPDCAREKKSECQRITTEEFVARAKEAHGDKYDYSLVEINGNYKTKVKVKCNACGTIFPQRINDHLNGCGCPVCAGVKKLTKEEFVAKAKIKHGNKYDYSLVDGIKNNKTKVKIKCNTCGTVFEQRVCNHLNGQGCPYCKASHLEHQARILLEKNNITFETQKKFPWLKNKKEMPLDFYLPEYNIAIECQGEQHYAARGTVFTEDKVDIIKQRDILKYKLCKEQGIPIYYIKYNENVEERFNKILSEIKSKEYA